MALAGIELRYLVDQISEQVQGYYISNIYGINKLENITSKVELEYLLKISIVNLLRGTRVIFFVFSDF